MADTPTRDGTEPPAPPASGIAAFVEHWGMPAAATLFTLILVETIVLTTLIKYGVDLGPLYAWIDGTFGTELTPPDTEPTWIFAFVLAWGIRRPLKPIEFALTAVLTPAVALLPWFRDRVPPTADPSPPR